MHQSGKFNPQDQLTKHGWQEGSGLGRDEHGIKTAIKVKLKFDTTGVGHNPGEQFSYHWWDHVFNKASGSIKVHNGQGEPVMEKTGQFEVSSKKGSKLTAGKDLLYGRFIKAATLDSGEEIHVKRSAKTGTSAEGLVSELPLEGQDTDSESDSDSSASDEDAGTASKLTDEELFRICGGRTAHKGARHGLGLGGKLKRLAQQEEMYISDQQPTPRASPPSEPTTPDQHGCQPEDKKTRKHKKNSIPTKSSDGALTPPRDGGMCEADAKGKDENKQRQKKKSSKKRKKHLEPNGEIQFTDSGKPDAINDDARMMQNDNTNQCEGLSESKKRKKSKKHSKTRRISEDICNNMLHNDESHNNAMDVESQVGKKQKKKRKR